jgi:transposase InsO family protein
MVDDHSRLAYAEVLADERGPTAVDFLRRASAWFGEHGVKIKRVMSDNGACYRWGDWSRACRQLGMRHVKTRPYRPRTNGKAERFIKTLMDEWAYARVYGTSAERTAALSLFLERYNFRRPHGLPRQEGTGHEGEQPRWELHLVGIRSRLRRTPKVLWARCGASRLRDP